MVADIDEIWAEPGLHAGKLLLGTCLASSHLLSSLTVDYMKEKNSLAKWRPWFANLYFTE